MGHPSFRSGPPAQFQTGLVENLTGLSASRSEGDDAEGAGGEQSEAGGLGGGGGWGLRGGGDDVGSVGVISIWDQGAKVEGSDQESRIGGVGCEQIAVVAKE